MKLPIIILLTLSLSACTTAHYKVKTAGTECSASYYSIKDFDAPQGTVKCGKEYTLKMGADKATGESAGKVLEKAIDKAPGL